MTLRELEALDDADRQRLQEQREMSALAAATLINIHRKRGTKPMAPLDFWEDPTPKDNPEDILAILARANDQRDMMRGARG